MRIDRSRITAIAALATCLVAAPAIGVEKTMETSANATANCQGALPNFEGAIRKRPLAVQNEGSAASFVSCSFSSEYDTEAQRPVSYFGAFFTNGSATARTVTCTGVAGYDTGDNTYVSKSVTVAPNRLEQADIFFVPGDIGGAGYYPLVSMSCNIPPGVGINDTYVGYVVDDD
jgi:hypothetical protein